MLLLLACFVPRALMAWKLDTVCPDGVLYFHLAESLERGERAAHDPGRQQLGTYPLALVGMHRLGLGWETAAEFYGVILGTLTVLPLWGWVRRQFDDRVALVACLLYAFHPKLIEWSPEAIREPSFWFFFTLSLYLLWRATVEVDWRFSLAAACAVAASCLTRFEGWFLLLPLVGWTLARLLHLKRARPRLAASFAMCTVALPTVLFLFGRLLPVSSPWEHVRAEPLYRAAQWLTSWKGADPVAPIAPVAAPATHEADWSLRQTTWAFAHTLERGLTPLFAILMLGGYFAHLRLFSRSDGVPILLLVLAVAGGIWIHVWYSHLASSRYVLTIVLVSTRPAALALVGVAQRASAWLASHRQWQVSPAATSAVLVAVAAVIGCADALSSNLDSRSGLAHLGEWIRGQYGEACEVVGSDSQMVLVGYYAHGSAQPFPRGMAGEALADWVEQVKPDVVVISQRKQLAEQYQPLVDRRERLGLEMIASDRIPGGAKHTIVLARAHPRDPALRQATRHVPGGT